jgi:alkylated DNA repair dioxygenase AlkB
VSVHQRSLFAIGRPHVDADANIERIDLHHGSWVDIGRGCLAGADTLLDRLAESVDWRQGRRWMFERMVDDPRLSRWYKRGDAFPDDALMEVKHELEQRYDVELGSVGLNYYRDGRDSVAFHRDRELRHLDDTLVAIVTLGARRPFLLRPRAGGRSLDLAPASGDLLVMGGTCQVHYEHGIPKVAHAGPRISASYRWSSKRGRPETTGVTQLQNG